MAAIGAMLACGLSCPRALALDPGLEIGQYGHTAWRIREGFTRGFVTAIAQGPDGYLWLGTEFGLLRFDGVRNVPFVPPPGTTLPSERIYNLTAAPDGTLWIGTLAGLASWNGRELRTHPEFDGLIVSALLVDREGTLWVGAQAPSAPAKLCSIRGGIRCFGEDGSLSRWISAVYEDGKGYLWVTTATDLWRWKPAPPERHPLNDPFATMQNMTEDVGGAIVVTTRAGPQRFVGGTFEPLLLPPANASTRPSKLLRDRDGAIWAATDQGLLHVHRDRVDTFSRADGLSGNSITRMFEDREGNIWVATQDGLDRFHARAATVVSVDQGLASATISSVLATRDGSVWISTGAGLNRWRNGRMTVYRERSPPASATARRDAPPATVREVVPGNGFHESGATLFEDSRGRVWVATHRGTGYFENERYVSVPAIPAGFIDSIAEDRGGNLWMAHRDAGLIRVASDLRTRTVAWIELGRSDHATRLAVDASGDGLWLGHFLGGVSHVVDGRVTATHGAAVGMDKGRIKHLHLDRNGALWIASPGGIARLNDGRLDSLTTRDGLPCDSVDWLVEGGDDTIWIYGACGLARVARAELDAWARAIDSGKREPRTIRAATLDSSDGVRNQTTLSSYSPHVARSADGRLWLVSSAGVTVVDPRRLPHNALLPPVHIEQLVADRRSFASTPGSGPVELPAQVRDLQIDYTATSLVAPEKMAFRYRLEGFDQGWREAGTRRQAFYTDLPPGNYRFRVIASNNSGVWNETGATLDFSIPAAYHQAAWFRALAVAALLLAAWAAYQWRVRSLANRLAQVQQENRERLKAEEALRDSEERYALAVAGSNEGIFDWDLRTDRVYLASHTQHLIGIPPGALWRSREEWKSLVTVHPDDVGRVHSHLKAHIAGRTPAYDVEFRFVLDGVPRWFSQRAVAVRDATGKAYRMVGQIGDIHERKTQQEELKRLEGRLRQAQRFEAMGTLAGGIAHDFNNILGAILGFGERALRAAGRDGRLRTDLDQVVAASHRGRALVETIQQFSRSGAGERVSVHVEKVVREALGLLQAKLPAGTRLITTLRAGRAAIVGDPTQVHQVVMNLGTNAMHAMRRGGDLAITLDVATFDKPRPAHVGTVEPGDHVVLNVADTGSGIPPEIIERIFDPFFTTKEVGAGSGLGLSLVLRIVTELGGAIDVISTVDVGTAFTVYFPRAGDARDDDDGVADLPLARGRGQRVLIVDDEVPLATLMSETLAELGYATVTFTSSTVALEAFRADPDGFDVLIADGRMPELSGQDLLRAVRRMRGSLPTMLISGDFGAARTGGTDGGGADIVLRKPVSMRDLASALARLLETRKTTG